MRSLEKGGGRNSAEDSPRVNDASNSPRPASFPLWGRVARDFPRGGETVMVVDDEPEIRRMLACLLDSCGYRTFIAGDGREALALADRISGPVHLLVTDVRMPHIGGGELAERMTERFPGMRVLFLSGCADDAVVRRCSQGEGVFLQKPFSLPVFARKVRETIERTS